MDNEKHKKAQAEWYQRNKERLAPKRKEQKAAWFQRNKEAIYEKRRRYFKKWRKENRETWNAYGREWKSKNKEHRKEYDKLWLEKNREKRIAYVKKYKRIHKDEIAERQRIRLLEYKKKVVKAYGGKCRCCGEENIVFLTVEHIKKNGVEHRRTVGGNFYFYLVKNGFPREHLAILCMNCNWATRLGSKCPHKKALLELVV